MTTCKTMPAPSGGYFGLYWSEKHQKYVKVAPVNAESFDSASEALRAAKHKVGNPYTMTAACPVPPPDPDFDALGINQWRRRKAEASAKAQLEAFGTIRIRGRDVAVERKKKGRRNGSAAV